MSLRSLVVALALAALVAPVATYAAGVDVSVAPSDITLAPALASYPAGTAVRVYVRIHNGGQEDTVASATLSVGDVAIGQASPVPVRAGGSAETWVDWVVPASSFRISATVSASGDGQQRNNTAQTDEFSVAAPAGRDIFSPPAGREGSAPTSSQPATTTVDASSTSATATEPTLPPVEYTLPPASPEPVEAAPLEEYSWIPYLLIGLGAVGFAWGMRGRRRGASYRTAVPVPVSVVRTPRRRPAKPKVYRPELVVEKAAPKPRRAPRRRPPAPPAPEQQA